jgi:hypothetical protein
MITNQVLGSVLLGVNEQINCSDCVSAFGSVGSFTAGVHGRKELTNNLSLLAGLAYTQYSENGYHVTSALIGAFALRYDFTDWGSSRPFFDIGTVLSPFQKVRYSRSYATSLGDLSLDSSTNSADYAAYGRAGSVGYRPATRSRARSSSGSYGSGCPAIPTDARVQSLRRHDRNRHRPHQPGQARRAMDASVQLQRRGKYQRRLCAILRLAFGYRRRRHQRWSGYADDL